MINVAMEICATVLDVVFLVWFISRYHQVSFYKKPITLLIPLGCLTFQLIADQCIPTHGVLYIVVFISFVTSSLSLL